MTRGRGGWLALPRTALSSAVSCRFIPTLSVPPTFRNVGWQVSVIDNDGPHVTQRCFSNSNRCNFTVSLGIIVP